MSESAPTVRPDARASSPIARNSPASQTEARADARPDRPPGGIQRSNNGPKSNSQARPAKPEAPIRFQKFFKSVGPRTYAAQIKEAGNGNQFLVITEGKREKDSDDVRKTRIFVFGEDFPAFFSMLHEAAKWIRENPIPKSVQEKRKKFWAKNEFAEKRGKALAVNGAT